jgi:pilus assembly protein FimV
MKRPLQLSLAIALALGVTDAFALGLGAIQVKSGLNQPLVAEIPVIQSSPGEAEGLIVQLASDEDFERVGLNRSSLGVPVEFSLGKNARGEPVIKITSREIVREPVLGFLVEANWPKGRLLREFTLLLDPPTMAPALKGSSAVAVAAKEPERARTEALPDSRPSAATTPAATAAPAKAAAPSRPATVRTESKPAPAAPRAISGNEYGPVAAGETLGEIARAMRPDESVSVNQMMLALLKSNPNAFYKNNINALKRGAVLRIPTADELAASGSMREAAAAVRAQIDEWRGGTSTAPTLVADTASSTTQDKPKATASTSKGGGERLALVPPREGKAGQNASDRPSGGTAGASGDVATKAELARVKEALTSREQEASELKSRVKDLEDIKGKNDKLISLQNSELAELRAKLKAMQDEVAKSASGAAPATTAAPAPSATATTPVAETAPAAAAASAVPATGDAKITKDDIWGDGAPSSTASPSATTETSTQASASEPVVETLATATPATETTAPATTTEPAAANVEASKPVESTPAKAEAPAKPATKPNAGAKDAKKPAAAAKPAVVESPWYMQPWVLGAAGVGGLLLVLLGVAGMRKRKPAASAARASIASSFGDEPIGGSDNFVAQSYDSAEEQELVDQIRRDPTNAGSHLELLSLYYAQGATTKFEAAAEEMYAYIADPGQPEWVEARKMGEELAPNNPLFGDRDSFVGNYSDQPDESTFSFDEPAESAPASTFEEYRFDEPETPAVNSNQDTVELPAFDFDVGQPQAPAASSVAATSPAESFSFDDLSPLDPVADAPIVTEFDIDPEPEAPAALSDEEFFAGEDAIGTKLDLAKAYLDMGDPDGARSMLEEVLVEGSPLQQAEARKLLAEIR